MPWFMSPLRTTAAVVGLLAIAHAAVATDATVQVPVGKTAITIHGHTHYVPRSTLAPAVPMKAPARGYSGAGTDVLTYHYDNNRTGWNPAETDLTPATVASNKFGLLKTLSVDGGVLAQPLLVSGFVMPDKSMHDMLIVVTAHNSVYAFDAATFATLWQVNLGPSESSNDIGIGCGDVYPEYGIESTPVIVRHGAAAGTIYLVAAIEPVTRHFHAILHALDLATGADLQAPTEIAPRATLANGQVAGFDPEYQWNRTGLAYGNGLLYVGIGSHCDYASTTITGWLVSYDTKLRQHRAFHTIETPLAGNPELASIWMSGFAPSIDDEGNVFVVTGNGAFASPGRDWGESALKLSASLTLRDRFTDSNYQLLSEGDTDFGSGGIMLIPPVSGQAAPPLAVSMGKNSHLYLLNRNHMGGLAPNDGGALQTTIVSGNGLWGGPAYYNGPTGGVVFAQTDSDVLRGYAVATGSQPSLSNVTQGTTTAGYGGSLPIVSSNGSTAGTGIVWLLKRSTPDVELEAYNAETLGAPIFSANVGSWNGANAFLTPIEANGKVFVPNFGTVSVFGLTQ